MVRASAVGMLRDLGYTCIHAQDGASALAILEQGTKLDLLFTDVVMPGPVKSRDLRGKPSAFGPDCRCCSPRATPKTPSSIMAGLDPGVQLISKPYAREDLARKVRGLLKNHKPVVLVVEDDALVRLAAVDMIEALGFRPRCRRPMPKALWMPLLRSEPIGSTSCSPISACPACAAMNWPARPLSYAPT